MGLKKDYLTENLLEKLSLKDKADSYVRYLSGGMKRRLMIAKGNGSLSPYTNIR